MAEDLLIAKGTKEEQYESLLPQIKALLEGEPDLIANLANVTGALKEQFNWLWIGFYLVKKDELVLGPFQGPVACTRIKKGKGVCGASNTFLYRYTIFFQKFFSLEFVKIHIGKISGEDKMLVRGLKFGF